MPRRNRPPRVGGRTARSAAPDRALGGGANQRVETWRGRDFVVRPLAGSSTSGPYRCPGCDQLLPAGVAHVVVWPAEDSEAEHRRHWHTSCWSARQHRAPVVERSRNATRYGR